MHSMSESAIRSGREARRQATAHRISLCAQELTGERGLDGFTMDELAEAAGVSRRTLFNYFPGKDAAVMGTHPSLDDALLERFTAGGPTGRLVDDIAVLVEAILEVKDLNRDDVHRVRALVLREPRLMAYAKQRFEEFGEEFLELVKAREGSSYDEVRARTVIQVMAALFDLAITMFAADPDTELSTLYAELLSATRSAFA
jgi:AcrR family transcriptional regulator